MFMKHNSKQFGKQFYISPSNFVIELAFWTHEEVPLDKVSGKQTDTR